MAAIGVRVKVVGLDKMDAALAQVLIKARIGAAVGIEDALYEIASAWADRVPVLEGHYRSAMQQQNAVSVYIKYGADPYGYVKVPWVRGVPKDEQPQLYARRLEFGDSEMAPQPAARPAVDATRPKVAEIVGDGIAARVR